MTQHAPVGSTSPSAALCEAAVFAPEFVTPMGPLRAGSAFAVFVPEVSAPVLVSCHHLFGPAGGLSQELPPEFMDRFVTGVVLHHRWSDAPVGRAGAGVALPGVDIMNPGNDVSAFVLAPQPNVTSLAFAERAPEPGDRVFLVTRLRAGAPPEQMLHPATVLALEDPEDGTGWITFDDPAIVLGGGSGAPVLDAAGCVIGMLVRGGPGRAQIVTMQRLRAVIGGVLQAS